MKHQERIDSLMKWDKITNIQLDKCSTTELDQLIEMYSRYQTGKTLSSTDVQLINNISNVQNERIPVGKRVKFIPSVHNSAGTITADQHSSNKSNTMARKKKSKKSNLYNNLTRTDKIVAIKNSNENDIVKTIDLHSCSDEELNKLYTIVSNQKKGIGRSASEYQFVNEMKEKKSNVKPVGKWS
jgi:hypothetical protein